MSILSSIVSKTVSNAVKNASSAAKAVASSKSSSSSSTDSNRNTALAGQSVKEGQYTVTYDDRGYVVRKTKDGGASATSTVKTTHANDSADHQAAYDAAQRGDWDAVGTYINKIGMAGGTDSNGNYDMGAANQYLKELSDEFKYNAKDYYDKKYEETYSPTSSGSVSSVTGSKAYPSQVVQNPRQEITAQKPMTSESADDSVAKYLQDMYNARIAADRAALKSTYEQNIADSEAQDDLISSTFQKQKNQTAAQNDLQRMQMNEFGIMRGLNTGTSGQMALSQNVALQGSLAKLSAQEAQSLSENALTRQKLTAAYKSAIDQAESEGKYQLASALYQEYVRQDELSRQEAAAAQEQANWEAKFDYQKQQDALADATARAELLAGFGDFSGYKALGYSDAQIAIMQNAYNAKYGVPSTGTPAARTPVRTGGYDNGNLSDAEVKALQRFYGTSADGMWGANSSASAGGIGADAAYAKATSGLSDFAKMVLSNLIDSVNRNGSLTSSQKSTLMSYVAGHQLTNDEANTILNFVS